MNSNYKYIKQNGFIYLFLLKIQSNNRYFRPVTNISFCFFTYKNYKIEIIILVVNILVINILIINLLVANMLAISK